MSHRKRRRKSRDESQRCDERDKRRRVIDDGDEEPCTDDYDDELPYGLPSRHTRGFCDPESYDRREDGGFANDNVDSDRTRRGEGGRNRERSRIDDDGEEEEEEEEWVPGLMFFDKDLYADRGETRERTECFGCRHVGERSLPMKKRNVQRLITTMLDGMATSDFAEHCKNVSEQYEETIRKKNNKRTTREEERLPEWSPVTISEHLVAHNDDPVLTALFFSNVLKKSVITELKNGYVKVHKKKKNALGEPLEEIEVKNWRKVKEMMDMWLKMKKCRPDTMIPFYHKNMYVNEENESANPLVDYSKKTVYSMSRLASKSKRN